MKTKRSSKTKSFPGKNKLGVKKSLVNNINARKEKNISRTKKRSSISKESYDDMKNNWNRKK